MVRSESKEGPLSDPRVLSLAAETVRKAHAVGLVDDALDVAELTYPAVRRLVARVREAGVGGYLASRLTAARPADVEAITDDLRRLDALLEESPFPRTEWRRLLQIFDRDRLAGLVGVSRSSAGRYARGARETPDEVAARLHFLALVTGDLAGAYNALGIRRWFERPRTALDGRSPAALLTAGWQPDDPGPARVRGLARSLVTSPAT